MQAVEGTVEVPLFSYALIRFFCVFQFVSFVLMQETGRMEENMKIKVLYEDDIKKGYANYTTIEFLDDWIKMLTALQEERLQKEQLQIKLAETIPKVVFSDAVTLSDTTILIGELAKLLKGNGLNIGQNRLFERLRNEGYLIKRRGTDYNTPTQMAMELGLFKVKETAITHSDGRVTISKTTKVTGKGQQYFINRYLIE